MPIGWRELPTLVTLVLKAKIVVELGTGSGWVGERVLEALEVTNGLYYTIDLHPNQEPVKSAVQKLLAKHPTRCIFIPGDSIEVGRAWDKGNIDVLICDSDHSYDRVFGELNTWAKFNPKVCFIHDTFDVNNQLGPPYHAAKDYAEKNGKLFFNYSFPHGLGVIL